MLLPETTAAPCVGGVLTATLAVPLAILSLLVTASAVVVFQGTETESALAMETGVGAVAVAAAGGEGGQDGRAMTEGIQRVMFLFNRSSGLSKRRARHQPALSIDDTGRGIAR